MKKLQQLCAVAALTFALALSALAGEMSTPGVTSPSPQQQSSATGDISFPGVASDGDISMPGAVELDPETEAALNLLRSLLSLF